MTDLFDFLETTPAKAPPAPMVGHGIPLRWCQREDVDAMMHAIETGYTHPCCVGATGYGKGPLIAEVAGRLRKNGGKVVALVDRSHLVYQLADEIERHLDVDVGRVADGTCDNIHLPIVVSTVQAMYTPDRSGRPLYEYPAFKPTKAVICDESHRFFADCYRGVLDYFAENNQAVVPLFTATPSASNGARWDSFVNWTPHAEGPCMRTVRWCVDNGYLVKPRQAFIEVNLDLAPIYEQLADCGEDEAESEDAEDASAVLLDLLRDKGERDAATFAAGVADVVGKRRAIVFSPPRVSAAKTLASWLNATGRMTCDAVWGGRGDKLDVLDRFRRGTPQSLSSVNLLCEGFNDPTVSAVFVCRLLKQWRMVQQMVGRALRPHPSIVAELNRYDAPDQAEQRRLVIARSVKPDALVADLVGLDGHVLQASAVEVLYASESEDVKAEIAKIIRTAPRPQRDEEERPGDDVLEQAKQQLATRQREQLEEMARRRAMAGEIHADVRVTTDGRHELPSVPEPIMAATLGEKAMFVAVALQYSVDAAVNIANSKPRHILRGMTWGMRKKLDKEGRRPDWNRARQAFPEWAASKRKGAA